MKISVHVSELGDNRDNATGIDEEAESLFWNNTVAPLLRQLESEAAGNEGRRWKLMTNSPDQKNLGRRVFIKVKPN